MYGTTTANRTRSDEGEDAGAGAPRRSKWGELEAEQGDVEERRGRGQVQRGGWFDAKFRLTERGTTVWREVRAGSATFLTMAYIVVVQSRLLGYPRSGIPRTDVMLGTAASSAVASFVCGWFGNLPFALAPGLGLSAYVSMQEASASDATTWQTALAACAVAGAFQMLLAGLGLSSALMRGTPRSVQSGTVVGMGLLLAFVGLQEVHVLEPAPEEAGLIQLSNHIYDPPAILAGLGVVLVAVLTRRDVPGAVLVTVFALTAASVYFLDSPPPPPLQQALAWPNATTAPLAWDFGGLDVVKHGPVVLAFILVGVFDVAGVLIGLSHAAALTSEAGQAPPGAAWAFFAAGLGTVVGAALGSTPVIVHLESAAGLTEGGKTGLTAVTTSLWFALSMFATPVLDVVPPLATAPVLILVGMLMMSQAHDVRWGDPLEGMPAFVALTTIPFTFSVPNGVAFGAVAATLIASADAVLSVLARLPLVGRCCKRGPNVVVD